MKKRTLISAVLILGILLISKLSLNAQEHKFQAVYIYNFTNYIEWPASYKSGNFVIGVLGSSDPIVSELNTIAASKKVFGQTIQIKTFSSAGSVSKCHVLFVSSKQEGDLSAAIAKVASFSTFIVTGFSGATSKGAAISFYTSGGKLKFKLNSENATNHGLKVSSELQKLAS